MTNNLTLHEEETSDNLGNFENKIVSSVDDVLRIEDEDDIHDQKQTTQSPQIRESDDLDDDFEDPVQTATKHTLVTSPWTRLGIIGVTFGLGFLSVFIFLNGIFNGNPTAKLEDKVNPDQVNSTTQAVSKNEKDGEVYAELALSRQEGELNKINQRELPKEKETIPQNKNAQIKVINKAPTSTRPPERPISRSAPREVPYTPPRISVPQTPPPPRNLFNAQTPTRIQAQALDPIAELNRLRNLGSFGKVIYTSSTDISNSDSLSNTQGDTSTEEQQAEEALFTGGSETIEQNNRIEKISPRWSAEKSTDKITNYLPEENQIIQGRRTQYLVVGEFARGVLVTPLVKEQSSTRNNQRNNQQFTDDGKRYVAKLTQDLHDNYGNVAVPAGTLLALEVLSVDGASYAQVQVRSIIKDNTEYPITAGAITVLGDGGNPLIASQFKDKGGEIAQYDLTVGLVSGLGKIGEIINKPDVEEDDELLGGIIRRRTRSNNNRRNIGGALLEGAFGRLSTIIGDRARTSTQEILNRPNVWYIPRNTKVTFLVNRTLELP